MEKQMVVAPGVPTLKRILFGELETGFYRYTAGEIWFAWTRGKVTYSFPVGIDGLISCHGSAGPFPDEHVDVIHPDALGIKEIRWEEAH